MKLKPTLHWNLRRGQNRRRFSSSFICLQEKTAYRPLACLLRLPAHEIDAIFGDAITTTSHRVMAAVFDRDPEPLYRIILDRNAEEFIRCSMCEAIAMVTLRGELDRALAGRFLRDAFMNQEPQAQNLSERAGRAQLP